MSKLKNDKAQYEKYLSGKMSAKEANAFEREVLNDPFEQEALEGFECSEPAAFTDIEKLQGKVLKKDSTGFGWMRIAAVVALLIFGSFTVWLVLKPIAADQELAQETQISEETVAEKETEEDLAPSFATAPEEFSASEQKKTFPESDVEVAEARPITTVENETEEVFKELEEVALADNAVDNLESAEISEIVIEMEAEDLGEEALAMESQPEDQVQSGAPVAILKTEAFQLDSLSSISLSQNLIANGDEFVDEIVAQDISTEKVLQGRAAGAQVKKSESVARSATARSSTNAFDAGVRTITGTITDDAGEGLPGVNVVIKGTTTGVTSDLDGNYRLSISPGATLVISFVGFESHEIEVGDRSVIDVSLGGVTELQEVVVTGYGIASQKAPSFTPARPVGGTKAYKKYIEENLRYPDQAINNEVEGTVTLELTISSNGTISNIDIKKSLGYGCDVEAIRLVREGPKWSGAEKNGSRVEDKVKVKVKFKR